MKPQPGTAVDALGLCPSVLVLVSAAGVPRSTQVPWQPFPHPPAPLTTKPRAELPMPWAGPAGEPEDALLPGCPSTALLLVSTKTEELLEVAGA